MTSRLSLAVAALVNVAYFSTLLDTPRRLLVAMPAGVPAQPVPAEDRSPKAHLLVEVVDEQGALVEGATVAVYALRERQAYGAGLRLSDGRGRASFEQVPQGDLWVLIEAEGRQRASTRLSLGPEGSQARVTLRKAHRLAVQVVDEAERAVAGATIEVRGGDPLAYVGKSGANGAFEFERLGPGPWSVKASAPGFEPASRSGVGAGLLPQRLALRSLGSLEVTVKKGDGSPVAGATVEVAGSGLWPARTAVTAEDGVIKVAALPAGAYNVTASSGDLVSETSIGTPVRRGEATPVELRLGQGRKVLVRVVDGEGDGAAPVPGAEVVLAEGGVSSFPRRAVANERGEVALGPVGLRPSSLGVRAQGFVPRSGVKVPPDLQGAVTVAMVRGATIVGEVVDRGDYPIDGASVEVIGVDMAGMPVDETPEHMSFREVHFSWSLSTPVALIPAGELGVMPGPLPAIPRGRQALAGDAPTLGGASSIHLPPVAPWVSGGDGRFRAGPVPPGRLRALVRHPAYVESISDAVTVGPGGEGKVKVQLRTGGVLSGRLVNVAGQPVAGARVEISSVQGLTVRSALTADDGTFTFSAVLGDVNISVSRPEAFEDVALRKMVTVDEGQRKEVELSLPEPREPVDVRVVDNRGFPLDNAQVTVLSLSVGAPTRATRFTRDDGVVQIPDAAGLSLRVEVSLSGYAPRAETFEGAGRELKVVLGKAASIEGEVTFRGGREAAAGAQVTVHAGSVTRTERTGADGRYALRGLPPGKARLVVQAKGFVKVERAISIPEPEADRAASIDRVDLAEGGEVEGVVVDKNGDPVVGARVALGSVPAFIPVGPLPAGLAVTDARGGFKLADIPESGAVIEAFSPDHGRGRAVNLPVIAGRTLPGVRIVLDTEVSQADPPGSGGVAITLAEGPQGPALVVRAVAQGSEADRAGVEVDDELLRVDDDEPRDLKEARKLLTGPVGEDVVLLLRRRGQEVKLRVPRERVRRLEHAPLGGLRRPPRERRSQGRLEGAYHGRVRANQASFTASFVAVCRGLSPILPEGARLVSDPFGKKLLGGPGEALIERLGRAPAPLKAAAWGAALPLFPWALYMQVRTRAIDDALLRFVEAGGRQVVILGAGFDARAFRLADRLRGASVFEIDHPATQARKRSLFGDNPAARYLPWDFERDPVASLPERLAEAGLDPSRPSFTLWEGVTMYLSSEAIEATLDAVRRYSAPGSGLTFNYVERALVDGSGPLSALVVGVVAAVGEPFRSGFDPAAIGELLEKYGFSMQRDDSFADLAAGMLPSPWSWLVHGGRRLALVERMASAARAP